MLREADVEMTLEPGGIQGKERGNPTEGRNTDQQASLKAWLKLNRYVWIT